MEDRYAGDLGDYSKLGLIRAIGNATLRVGLVWCLADDESHNGDGRHIDYLTDDRYGLANCDRRLHAALARMLERGERSVAALEQLNVWPDGMRFFAERLSFAGLPAADRLDLRRDWQARALDATTDSEVVFFDPDNGLQVPSVGPRSIKAPKYTRFDELEPFWRRGQSLVIYQHLTRQGSADQQAARRCGQLREHLGAAHVSALRFSRGSARLYLTVAQRAHRRALNRAQAALLADWSPHFVKIATKPAINCNAY